MNNLRGDPEEYCLVAGAYVSCIKSGQCGHIKHCYDKLKLIYGEYVAAEVAKKLRSTLGGTVAGQIETKEIKLSTYWRIVGHSKLYPTEAEAKKAAIDFAVSWQLSNGRTKLLSITHNTFIEPVEIELPQQEPTLKPLCDAHGKPIVYSLVNVPSLTDWAKTYEVGLDRDGKAVTCSCPDYEHRGVNQPGYVCKHIGRRRNGNYAR